MNKTETVAAALARNAKPASVAVLQRFFKTGPGEYAEGDIFHGVTVPQQRAVARKLYTTLSLDDIATLLASPIHEHRLTALFILIEHFNHAESDSVKKDIAEFYLSHLAGVNNWDLVDSSAYKILGAFLFSRKKDILYSLAKSGDLWKERIAIIASFHFIQKAHYSDTLQIAELLLHHKHDLIHKAVGWMLREVGKRDYDTEYAFLIKHYRTMPRTMLRYAIERFEAEVRKGFLKGTM